MKLSEIVIKVIGLVLALVGFGLILAAVGLNVFGVGLSPWWLEIIVGVAFLGAGIWILRGGQISL